MSVALGPQKRQAGALERSRDPGCKKTVSDPVGARLEALDATSYSVCH